VRYRSKELAGLDWVCHSCGRGSDSGIPICVDCKHRVCSQCMFARIRLSEGLRARASKLQAVDSMDVDGDTSSSDVEMADAVPELPGMSTTLVSASSIAS